MARDSQRHGGAGARHGAGLSAQVKTSRFKFDQVYGGRSAQEDVSRDVQLRQPLRLAVGVVLTLFVRPHKFFVKTTSQ